MRGAQPLLLGIALTATVFIVHTIIIVATTTLDDSAPAQPQPGAPPTPPQGSGAGAPQPSLKRAFAFALVNAIASGAFLAFIAKTLSKGVEKIDFVLKMVLGAEYVKGTWVGTLTTAGGQFRYFVQHCEQTTLRLVVRGWSFPAGATVPDANWQTVAAVIDGEAGRLYCLYETGVPQKPGGRRGIGEYRYTLREDGSPDGAPVQGAGEAWDAGREEKITYHELIKVNAKLIPHTDALEKLKELIDAKKAGQARPAGTLGS